MNSTKKPRQTILIADDSKLVLARYSDLLNSAGYDVVTSTDVYIASLVRQSQPDLILMDVSFGSDVGPIAVKSLKRRKIQGNATVVLFSARSEIELNQLALDCEADGYIRKSDDDAAFLREVAAFLGS